jgi:hypothetical protein
VRVYVGQTRASAWIARLAALDLGECTNRGELPPRRRPFFHDNAAFADFKSGRSFQVNRWLRDLRWMAYRGVLPDFIVLPDRVGGGLGSLTLSLDWREVVPPELQDRCYLVVQEGMTPGDVAPHLAELAGLFVGGASIAWKMGTASSWIALAHAHGKRCHIGRVGTPDRLLAAARLGADSVDSALPVRHRHHFDRFLGALEEVRGQRRPAPTLFER